MKKILFAILTFSFTSHDCIAKVTNNNTFEIRNDSIFSKLNLCGNTSANKSFFQLHDHYISSDYIAIDSVKKDVNKDGIDDMIYVLDTYLQKKRNEKNSCYFKTQNSRLLVIFLSNKKSFNVIVNENIILNRDDRQFEPFKGIKKTETGIIIKFLVGATTRCDFSYVFKCIDRNLYLTEINSDCYLIDLRKEKKSTKRFNISDNLKLSNLKTEKYINDIFPGLNR